MYIKGSISKAISPCNRKQYRSAARMEEYWMQLCFPLSSSNKHKAQYIHGSNLCSQLGDTSSRSFTGSSLQISICLAEFRNKLG